MISENKIYFFEVEEIDRELVAEKYPTANIFAERLSPELIKKCVDAEIVCGMIHSDFSAESLQALPNLKLLITRSAGYDHIDTQFTTNHQISVCFVPDYGSYVIAEHVFALMLASLRNVLKGSARTIQGDFSAKNLRGTALKDKTLGVIGTGRIGSHVCRIASQGFQMNVIGYDPQPNKELEKLNRFRCTENLNEIWRESDIISLHVPLSPSTRHLINTETINKMRDGVTLINTARGGIIDTSALITAIRAGKFKQVALDVIEHETDPQKDAELIHLPNVLTTPHIAFCTDDSVKKMYTESFKSIDQFTHDENLTLKIPENL